MLKILEILRFFGNGGCRPVLLTSTLHENEIGLMLTLACLG